MSLEPQPRWQPRRGVQWLTVIVAVAVTLGILIYIGYGLQWTGFGPTRASGGGQPPKTLWEWLGLLIVPAMLAAGAFWINQRQKQHDEGIQAAQREREETAAIQRAQDEALGAYLDQMSDLIVDREMRKKPDDPDLRRLAQARTLAILLGLDQDRKRRPLRLIYELNLIMKEEPILNLKNAGLDTADLSEITLHNACLREVDLRRANLSGADLKGSDLGGADLRGANLSNANLSDTVLVGANLLPYDETQPAKLNAPSLSNGTDPSDIDTSNDHLKLTNLEGADLRNADLSGAYLTGAGVSEEQLVKCKSLQGATMPDGRKYEDWLEDKRGQREGQRVMPDGSRQD
jgi:uncharacterized protein YjbI with pentapeptide repeats